MLPVLSSEQVRKADAYTIEHEPIASIDLMERAAQHFCDRLADLLHPSDKIIVLCGPGNNGGDGLAITRILLEKGYEISPYIFDSENYSNDFSINLKKLSDITEVRSIEDFDIEKADATLIIDAIFGSGLSRPPKGIYERKIGEVNGSGLRVVSVDIPSGLFADKPSSGPIIRADVTLTFQVPKIAFLLPENAKYYGEWELIDIGLMEDSLNPAESFLIEPSDVAGFIPKRSKYSHKSDHGNILLAGGSYGKMGAIVMAAKASLRSGGGLTTTYIPGIGYDIMQISAPEVMTICDPMQESLSAYPTHLRFETIGVGPGMGTSVEAVQFLEDVLESGPKKLLVDADGLNILSENRELLKNLPSNAILTPHSGEFKRLVGAWKNDFERLELLKEFCRKFNVITVLKGAHSTICTSQGTCYFNASGNAGMATAGSGDVLSGIITAFLGKMENPLHAAIAGVHIHGLAGDFAADDLGEESMIATDLIHYLPAAFMYLEEMS